MHWMLLLGIAVSSDVLDFFGAGVPIVGDVLDLVTVSVLLPFIGIETSLGLVELVPGADILPTYTALALWRILHEYRKQGHLRGLDVPRKELWRR